MFEFLKRWFGIKEEKPTPIEAPEPVYETGVDVAKSPRGDTVVDVWTTEVWKDYVNKKRGKLVKVGKVHVKRGTLGKVWGWHKAPKVAGQFKPHSKECPICQGTQKS